MVTSAAECPQRPPCISARLLYFIPIILWRQDKLSGPNFLSDMLQLSLMLRNLIKDSREHFDCTKAEALDALRKNGADLATFVAGLSDDELDRKRQYARFWRRSDRQPGHRLRYLPIGARALRQHEDRSRQIGRRVSA